MGGSCQRTWEHAIPKTVKPVGPRISIQFRPQTCAEPQAFTADTPSAEQFGRPLGVDGCHRLVRDDERVRGDDHHERSESGDVVVKLAGTGLSADRGLDDSVRTVGRNAVDLRRIHRLDDAAHSGTGESDLLAVFRRSIGRHGF